MKRISSMERFQPLALELPALCNNATCNKTRAKIRTARYNVKRRIY